MILSVAVAVLVFVGVSNYLTEVNKLVGPMVTVYQVTQDLPAFTTLSAENTEPASVPEQLGGRQHGAGRAGHRRPGHRGPADRRFAGEHGHPGAGQRSRPR